jgi:tetratricopeptide (TPR) repeat protein
VDAQEAIEHFGRCLKLDPGFAAAYVSMAEADLFVAEYDVTGDRRDRFEQAWRHGQELIAEALEIDPGNGEAFLHRAYLTAFVDLARAEKDYRRGLELSPNSAKGHAGLAAVVYETPERRDEALQLLDRARKLDPLEPGYDVTKALFLLMARGALEESNALLVDVVKRHPKYPPALARLAELRYLMGEAASSILYGEQALELDPAQEMIRRNLVSAYVDLGERAAAEQLLDEDELPKSPRRLKLLMHEHAWREAGEIAYETMSRGGLLSDIEAAMHVAAIRMHARTTGDFARGILALERASGVTWDATGNAVLPIEGSPLRDAAIGLADVLIAGGQETRGRSLLTTIIARMRHEQDELAVPEFWYYRWHPTALALNGEHDAALAMMRRAVASGLGPGDWWYYYESEPAYAALRRDPGFQATLETVRTRVESQRVDLERMRRDKLVPDRG